MDLSQLTDEELSAELERRKAPPKAEYEPRRASDYTPQEKCAAFNKLHAMALEHWGETKKDGWADEDFNGHAGEAVLELLAHPGDTIRPPIPNPYVLGSDWPQAPFW